MAINFPAITVDGQTYDYQGIRYTAKVLSTSPIVGYWRVTTPGTFGTATPAEVAAGTDNVKYVTPEALKDSDEYIRGDGSVLMDADPVNDLGVVTKQYVDGKVSNVITDSTTGSDSTIQVIQFDDGRMEIRERFNYAPGTAPTYNGVRNWPVAFVGALPVVVWATNSNFGNSNGYIMGTNSTLTLGNYRMVRTAAGSNTNSFASYVAYGRWK